MQIRKIVFLWFVLLLLQPAGFTLAGDVPTIQDFFNALNKDNINLVDTFYDEAVVFVDPVVRLTDRQALKAYYGLLYEKVTSVRFEFTDEVVQGPTHVVFWTMHFQTEGLNRGKLISVEGVSRIEFGGAEGKAVYHRDYFDMGAFIYENVPVLGRVIRYVKKKIENR